MAYSEPVPTPPLHTDWKEMENLVNFNFDRIIEKMNARRNTILSKIQDFQAKESNLLKSIQEVENTKRMLQEQMRNNLVVSLQERTIAEFSDKLSSLQIEADAYSDYMFVCSGKELDRALSNYGSIELRPKHYLDKGVPKVTVSHSGLISPARASFDESLDLIAITEITTHQILLFTMKGDFIQSFGNEYFKFPGAVKIINNTELVVSDLVHQTISKVEFDKGLYTKPKITPVYEQANRITSLDYDRESEQIYATSSANHCVLVLTKECKLVARIQGFRFPQCIFVSKSELYVLDYNNPALHIISKSSHELIRSIIPRGIGLEVEKANSFTLDQDGNVIIGKALGSENMIQVYSPSGQFLHSFYNVGTETGSLSVVGIFVTRNKDLIVISHNQNFPIQIF